MQRTVVVSIKLTPNEKREFERMAVESGNKLSSFMRQLMHDTYKEYMGRKPGRYRPIDTYRPKNQEPEPHPAPRSTHSPKEQPRPIKPAELTDEEII